MPGGLRRIHEHPRAVPAVPVARRLMTAEMEHEMRQLLGWTAAAVMAVAMVGCASTGPTLPCEKCDYGYTYNGKRSELKKFCAVHGDKATCCIKDGKMYDCSKNPMECPECAKNAGK